MNNNFMKIMYNIVIILLGIGGICGFICSISLLSRNNNTLEDVVCVIENIKDVNIEHNIKAADSMSIELEVSYNKNHTNTMEVVIENIILCPKTENDKEKMFDLKPGDEITLKNTIYGLSLYTENSKIIEVLITSITICLVAIILFVLDIKKDKNEDR